MNAFQTAPFNNYHNYNPSPYQHTNYHLTNQIESSNVSSTNCNSTEELNVYNNNCSIPNSIKFNNHLNRLNRSSDCNFQANTLSNNSPKPHTYTELVSPFTYLNEVELEASDCVNNPFNISCQQTFTNKNKPDYGLISHSGFAYGTPSPPSSACSSNGQQSYQILNNSTIESFHEEELNNSLVICQLEDAKQNLHTKNSFAYCSSKSQNNCNRLLNAAPSTANLNEYNFMSNSQTSTLNASLSSVNPNFHDNHPQEDNLNVLQNLITTSEQHLSKLNNCFSSNESHSVNNLNYDHAPSLLQPQLKTDKNVKYVSNTSNTLESENLYSNQSDNDSILNTNKQDKNAPKACLNLGIILGYDSEGRPIRSTANKKERRRTLSINNAFSNLRECIPNVPSDTKLSKIKTLRLATSYISYLMELLDDSSSSVNMNGKRNRLMMTCEDFKVDLQRFKGRAKNIHLLHEMEKKSTRKSSIQMENLKTENIQSTVCQMSENDHLIQQIGLHNKNNVVKQENTCHNLDNNLFNHQLQAKNVQLYHQVPFCKADYGQQVNKRIKGRTGWPQAVWASELQETQT